MEPKPTITCGRILASGASQPSNKNDRSVRSSNRQLFDRTRVCVSFAVLSEGLFQTTLHYVSVCVTECLRFS